MGFWLKVVLVALAVNLSTRDPAFASPNADAKSVRNPVQAIMELDQRVTELETQIEQLTGTVTDLGLRRVLGTDLAGRVPSVPLGYFYGFDNEGYMHVIVEIEHDSDWELHLVKVGRNNVFGFLDTPFTAIDCSGDPLLNKGWGNRNAPDAPLIFVAQGGGDSIFSYSEVYYAGITPQSKLLVDGTCVNEESETGDYERAIRYLLPAGPRYCLEYPFKPSLFDPEGERRCS